MLLDSTFIIDFLHGKAEALSFIRQQHAETFSTTDINVFELVTGIYASKKKPEPALDQLFSFLKKLTILPLTKEAVMQSGKIAGTLVKEGRKIEGNDTLIAGIALVNGIDTIVTNNKKHFERIPSVKVIVY